MIARLRVLTERLEGSRARLLIRVLLDASPAADWTRPGGLISGDDYREGGWWDGGVKKAVDELAASGAASVVHLAYGQFVFERLGA